MTETPDDAAPSRHRPPARASGEHPRASRPRAANAGSGRVRLWFVDVDTLDHDRLDMAVLSPDEIERAERFRFERDRRRYVATRVVLRALLAEAVRTPAACLRLVYGPLGKPALDPVHESAIQFNVAHSDRLALIALAHGRRVGVDVERVRPVPDLDRLVAQSFHPIEARALRGLPPDERRMAFFTCWTRKEAYLKAVGAGLSGGLTRFAVSVLPGAKAELLHFDQGSEPDRPWTLADVSPEPEFPAAAVVEGLDCTFVREVWHG